MINASTMAYFHKYCVTR